MKSISLFLFVPALLVSTYNYAQRNPAVKIYKKVNDAVVRVATFHRDNSPHGQASGVILKSKGWVVTNYHVMGDAFLLVAEHNGKEIRLSKIVRKDPIHDILIFQIDSENSEEFLATIPDLKIAESSALQIGQTVYAIGSPMGLENTISNGIISGLRANTDSTKNYIQISAPFSEGSSGGAVVDDRGRLIGISTFVFTGGTVQNLNFAIRIDDVLHWDVKLDQALEEYNTLMEQSLKEINSKDYYKALEIVIKASKKYSKDLYISNYYLGKIYEGLDNNDSAYFYYSECIELNPRYAEAYLGLARICMSKMQFDKAMEFQQKHINMILHCEIENDM